MSSSLLSWGGRRASRIQFEFKGRKISDNLYDFRKDRVEEANATIVFIHSLGLDLDQHKDAYYTTWVRTGEDGTTTAECWPSTLLGDSFPSARILTMKIDLSAVRSDVSGRSDLDRLTDNLVIEMISDCREPLGQEGPVILVTHGLGAIVAQKFVLAAVERWRAIKEDENCRNEKLKLQRFLQNVRGLFYYSPIFAGSEELNKRTGSIKRKGPVVKYVPELSVSSSRDVQEFQTLISTPPYRQNIKTMAVGEENVTRTGGFSAQVVTEGTSNIRVDKYVTVAADHIGVCQPKDSTSNSFYYLQIFVEDSLERYDIRE